MYRIESNEKPETFIILNDGTYYYNYDILDKIELEKEHFEDFYRKVTKYSYILVLLMGTPSYDKCVLAIIRLYISEEDEFKLINDYAAKDIPLSEVTGLEYLTYLNLLEEIKYKVKLDFGITSIKDPVKEAIKEVLRKILNYDSSIAVNSFSLFGKTLWINKETRTSLKLRFESELATNLTVTTIWHEGIEYSLDLEKAILMLYALEIYASRCYDCTLKHLTNVSKLTNITDIYSYDFTVDYPEKLIF